MSGDVQPRKRKDKKKKRDDESSHGVHITKMGTDDVHLHVHQEHDTGGHWCAKIIFFSLMAILMGLVCLIILENRGIQDADTPLSESRFSNYFNGWVDEHRVEHDDHHDSVPDSLEHDDEHDEHEHDDEPFEEEADYSEGEDEVADEEYENVTPEDVNEDENITGENITAEEVDEDEEDEDNVTVEEENATAEEEDDKNVTLEDENVTAEQNDEADDEEDDDTITKETTKSNSKGVHDDEDDAFDEGDDDGNFDSLEKIVDNDAAEIELLKEKARQQAAADSKQNAASAENDIDDEDDNAPSWASSQIKPKTGGGPQSLEDDKIDLFEQELRRANDEMMQEHYGDALKLFDKLIKKYPHEPQTYLGKAQTLDHYAEQQKSNSLLREAIKFYTKYLQFNVKDNQLQEYRSAGERCVVRLRFLGEYNQAIPIHKFLIKKFPQEPYLQNQMVVTLLMSNRLLAAKLELQNILKRWPQNGLAMVHYGFVLKQLDLDYYNAAIYLRRGIDTNEMGTQDGRFYFQLGESLQRLGKQNEAVEVFRKGAELKLFPSVYQRSLYNEPNLKAQPFWSVEETTYEKYFQKLKDNFFAIKAEALSLLSKKGYFEDEFENLRNKGEWKQYELYSRGRQHIDNCMRAPITCRLIEQFPAARSCGRGQVKFSVIHSGTHVWPHCGPTNCRLRAHFGLVVPKGTRIRVAEEERTWQEGEFLIFDDSFEHEVWHEGEGFRLVLIVDIWHPDLTEQQRLTLYQI